MTQYSTCTLHLSSVSLQMTITIHIFFLLLYLIDMKKKPCTHGYHNISLELTLELTRENRLVGEDKYTKFESKGKRR